MRIGIDIDGVLTDIEQWELDYFSKYYYLNYNKKIINPKGNGSYNIFEANEEQDCILWDKAIYEYVKEPSRKFASEVISRLKNENNEIYIITNRCSDLSYVKDLDAKSMAEIVKKWLIKYDIYYDKLVFSNHDKVSYITENKIDLMIEDNPLNINNISKVIPVICYNAGYNEICKGNNIYRAYTWYDIYRIIKEEIKLQKEIK